MCLCVSLHVDGQTNLTETTRKYTPITSHQRHFIVTDMPKRDAFEIAVWAESVRERLSEWVGEPIPGERSYPIVISAVLRTNEPNGRVLKAQDVTEDGFLRQEITMINPADMDQEDVLESLCWLLLNRWIQLRQPAPERIRQPGSYPDWLAVGIAQNLYPELRERNHQEVRARENNGEYQSAITVFDQIYLAPGRWPEKARAGLVVAWMAETMTPAKLVAATANERVAGGKLDGESMQRLLGLSDARSLNMAWDVWMARQNRRLIPGVMSGDLTEVLHVLELRPEMFGVVTPTPLPEGRLTIDMLIEGREYEWVHRYSRAVSFRLRQHVVGKTPELVAHIKPFIDFFDALAQPGEPTGKKKKTPPKSARWLRTSWREASAAWTIYLAEQQKQQELFDRFANPLPTNVNQNSIQDMLNRWEPE